jgi:inorganic pyrophosphatase
MREWQTLSGRRREDDMTNLLKLPTWADKQRIYAVVETPRGSACKLDFDSELRVFTLAGLAYPYN